MQFYSLEFVTLYSFNSLQTGRTFRTNFDEIDGVYLAEFQFPSNGKDFPNLSHRAAYTRAYRKAFQFPSNGKDFPNETRNKQVTAATARFQFPSNGKDFPNYPLHRRSLAPVEVSIPFKREGLSERVWVKRSCIRWYVSIPFKREGLSEQHPLRTQSQQGLK